MDKLFIGDIPQDYHYALFNNGYIDLYNTPVLHNNTYSFYRVYTNCDGFYYDNRSVNVSQYTTTYTTDIEVSSSIVYRQDFDSIVVVTFIFVLYIHQPKYYTPIYQDFESAHINDEQ